MIVEYERTAVFVFSKFLVNGDTKCAYVRVSNCRMIAGNSELGSDVGELHSLFLPLGRSVILWRPVPQKQVPGHVRLTSDKT